MSLTERRGDHSAQDVRRAVRRMQLPPAPTVEVTNVTQAAPTAHSANQVSTPLRLPPARVSKPVVANDAGLHAPSPIIPAHSVTGRALLAVIAIMSFLAAATLGTVVLVRQASSEWQGQVSREFTIQVRPLQGRDIEADVARAATLARTAPGVSGVRVYTRAESARLLEPWLGSGLAIDELPIPRLIVVTLDAGSAPDPAALRGRLAELSNASLDDHRAWVERMRSMAQAAVAAGFGVLALVVIATVLLVTFATRGAMTANRTIVEVLHFVGAKNRYIASQFQRHFLLVGLKGAAMGGGAAAILFLAAWLMQKRSELLDAHTAALIGAFTLDLEGYAGMLGVLVLIGAVTALTSRWTVHRTLNSLD